ncbi:MAG TPA: winged helix-turn-helix domain-containing protein [Methanomassiliicoccales archaeon]|jgi:DNA-binding transcriptional ArsR family regulator
MNQEEIVVRLERLRVEMDSLGQELKRSNQEMMRSSMDGVIRDALSKNGRDMLDRELGKLRGQSTCENRGRCLDSVNNVASDAMAAYLAGDTDGALKLISSLEENIRGIASPCGDEGCSDDCLRLMDDVRERIALSEKLRMAADGGGSLPIKQPVTAEDVFRSLDPLSHPARVEILMLLSGGDLSFTEVSKRLNLRTGHLQYHMKSLLDAGYVNRKVNRGPFSLTKQGSIALNSAMEMARRLRA